MSLMDSHKIYQNGRTEVGLKSKTKNGLKEPLICFGRDQPQQLSDGLKATAVKKEMKRVTH